MEAEAQRAAWRNASARYREGHTDAIRAAAQCRRQANVEVARERERAAAKKYRAKRAAYMRVWRQRNLQKVRGWNRRYREQNPRLVKNGQMRAMFGITLDQYEAMHSEQGGVCACCGLPESAIHNKTRAPKRLSVDHDHATGEVRGLLCGRCNTALGLLDDDPSKIRALIAYLSRPRLITKAA